MEPGPGVDNPDLGPWINPGPIVDDIPTGPGPFDPTPGPDIDEVLPDVNPGEFFEVDPTVNPGGGEFVDVKPEYYPRWRRICRNGSHCDSRRRGRIC